MVVIVNHKSHTKIMWYILQPIRSLLLVNIQDSLHCKQGSQYIGNIILQLFVVYETESTTSVST